MKGLKYIGILLAFCFTTISCEREDETRYPVQGTGRPIVFNVESEWPEITKTIINTSDDIKNIGFKVWGNWSPKSDGTSEYPVFGNSGTNVSYLRDSWVCADEQFWYKGYYSFAAVLPSSLLNGTYDNNKLILDLGESGFDLAETQEDLMFAFSNIDNSKGDASDVDLVFNHTFSLLDIRLKRNGAFVTKVMLYGIHKRMEGKLELEYAPDGGEYSTNLEDVLSEVTTDKSPYYVKSYSAGQGFNYSNNEISLLKTSTSGPLLVFPEDLAQTPLTVVVGLKDGNQEKEVRAVIDTGEWTPGSTNVYLLEYNK